MSKRHTSPAATLSTPLNIQSITETIEALKMTPYEVYKNRIGFTYEGGRYLIECLDQNHLYLYIGFSYNSDEMPIMRKAAKRAMEMNRACSIEINLEQELVIFCISCVEKSLEQFKEQFLDYLDGINYGIACYYSALNSLLEEEMPLAAASQFEDYLLESNKDKMGS